jgi:gamma-glutamylcyclotransferase
MGTSIAPKDTISNCTILYFFGYGSNLWLQQMPVRCPRSTFVGIARLRNYRWIINERGSANLVPLDPSPDSEDEGTHVWGLVYNLTKSDEARLDRNEGVPNSHTKENHVLEFWSIDPENVEEKIDISAAPEKKQVLLYIDRKRTKDDKPREEYIYRINMGIIDALKVGIPSSYVEKVIKKFIPETDGPVDPGLLVQVQKKLRDGTAAMLSNEDNV